MPESTCSYQSDPGVIFIRMISPFRRFSFQRFPISFISLATSDFSTAPELDWPPTDYYAEMHCPPR